jgi:heme-degrading monooxygenase HmoA
MGKTDSSRSDAYLEILKKTGVPELKHTPGNQGVLVLRRVDGDVAEFAVVSFWESTEAIEQFAGKDIAKARYYPEDEAFLFEMAPELDHFDVAVAEGLELQETEPETVG